MQEHTAFRAAPRRPIVRSAARAFTLVELLVVIGIIGLLIGLLLPALGKVIQRAKSTQTQGTMQEFAKACDAYFQEFGEYPAAVPDEVLYASSSASTAEPAIPPITAAENALLALMGGYRLETDPDYATFGQSSTPPATELTFNTVNPPFRIKVDATKMGEGPLKNGKKFDAFYAPKGREFGKAAGQISAGSGQPEAAGAGLLPDILDAWGAPIIFLKQQRGVGPIVARGSNPGQFERNGMLAYSASTSLGDAGVDQTDTLRGSVLNTTSAGGESGKPARDLTLGQLIRHGGINSQSATGSAAIADKDRVWAGVARGKYFLMSAGPDGIYFSRAQATNTSGTAITDIVSQSTNPAGPQILERYDDIIVSGGS